MLKVVKYDTNNNYRVIENNSDMFHEALNYVLRGEKRFHVVGEKPFDLVYENNDQYTKANRNFPNSDFFHSELFFPPYYFYDENDLEKINLELLEGFEEIFFEEVNEYTIVIGKLAIENFNIKIIYRDDSILLFPWMADKVNVSIRPTTDKYLYVQSVFYSIYTTKERFCTIGLFHCMFLLQWLTDLPKDKIKYLSLCIRKTEGIGSVLSTYNRVFQAFNKKGIIAYIEPGSTRFKDELLAKYFAFVMAPVDSNKDNTVYVKCFNSFVLNYFIQHYEAHINLDILQPVFLEQMKEYADSIIGNKKVLGVLLRGTDIIIANYVGAYRPASLKGSIEIIDEEFRKNNYDNIFVATEDSYFLDAMLEAFPDKILTVSQERHSITEFKDVKYISDLEKQKYEENEEEYLASVEDTTVNYFYAMYLLSRCDSLISNCMCSGVNLAVSFNEGKYKKKLIISEMI